MFEKVSNAVVVCASVLSLGTLTACTSTSGNSGLSSSFSSPQGSASKEVVVRGRTSNYVGRTPGRPALSEIDYPLIYGARNDGGVAIEAFDYKRMDPKFLRQQVAYFGPEPPGTIIVDAKRRHLYLVEPGRKAMRYGIAVGKEGHAWTGSARLQWKQKWPTWTPPKEMIERKPELKKYADGLAGSPQNPLGARAMYLFKNGKDTLYRIHGTDKPHSIGKAASSGCFRMINQDVIDLYDRVGVKGAVHVRPQVDQRLVAQLRGR
ncbi:MAG: L,D-transpeptidase [Ahrensia sp.]|nr:L,D-transpeptidase [Ahrensia sp.]